MRGAVALAIGRAVGAGPTAFGAGPAGLAGAGYQQYEVTRPVGARSAC